MAQQRGKRSGAEKLAEFIEGQGGDPRVIEDHGLFRSRPLSEVHSETDGLSEHRRRAIGLPPSIPGGRAAKGRQHRPSAVIMLNNK
jgi:thymidine phosphorylase